MLPVLRRGGLKYGAPLDAANESYIKPKATGLFFLITPGA